MIAYGTDENGIREVLGFGVYADESKETWMSFMNDLKKRGLKGLLMITSDAREGIRCALEQVFPDVPWQRCQFHFSKNIADKAPEKFWAGLRGGLREMSNAKTGSQEEKRRDVGVLPGCRGIMTCLDEGFESAVTVMILPVCADPAAPPTARSG